MLLSCLVNAAFSENRVKLRVPLDRTVTVRVQLPFKAVAMLLLMGMKCETCCVRPGVVGNAYI